MSWREIDDDEIGVVNWLLRNKIVSTGTFASLLEKKLSFYLRKKHCLTTASCSLALNFLFEKLKLNWKKVYVSNPETYCDSLASVVKWNNNQLVPIEDAEIAIIVREYGDNFNRSVLKQNCLLIEDVTRAPFIENTGEYVILSLGSGKKICGCEGGVLASNSLLIEELREKRDKLARLSDLHAAIALAQLNRLVGGNVKNGV